MKLQLENFSRFASFEAELKSVAAPNGAGKTTLLNAYLYALTGRTLTGFEPRKIGTPDSEPTTVVLSGVPNMPMLRRTYIPATGAILYVSENMTTQTDFVRACAERGIDVDFAALCADANVLTNPALTSEDLRKLLVRADVIDNGEAEALRKEATEIRKKKKVAEQYALSNVTIPLRTVEPITEAERKYYDDYVEASRIADLPELSNTCETCGQPTPEGAKRERSAVIEKAKNVALHMSDEAARIIEQLNRYKTDMQAIADAQRLIDAASKAREDVAKFDARLAEIDASLRELDANTVRADLPDGVDLVTESTAKCGTSKSVCTLTWNGIPLKSVNRAKRIGVCVELLANARKKKGMEDFPIIVDNAESVLGLGDISNLIRLSVRE